MLLMVTRGDGSSLYFRQGGLGLGEPKAHVHDPVEVDGRGQGGAGLLRSADLGIQGAEAEMAVGLEWPHAQCSARSSASR